MVSVAVLPTRSVPRRRPRAHLVEAAGHRRPLEDPWLEYLGGRPSATAGRVERAPVEEAWRARQLGSVSSGVGARRGRER